MSSVQIGCRGASLLELALHVFSPAVYTVFFEAERIRQRKVGGGRVDRLCEVGLTNAGRLQIVEWPAVAVGSCICYR